MPKDPQRHPIHNRVDVSPSFLDPWEEGGMEGDPFLLSDGGNTEPFGKRIIQIVYTP